LDTPAADKIHGAPGACATDPSEVRACCLGPLDIGPHHHRDQHPSPKNLGGTGKTDRKPRPAFGAIDAGDRSRVGFDHGPGDAKSEPRAFGDSGAADEAVEYPGKEFGRDTSARVLDDQCEVLGIGPQFEGDLFVGAATPVLAGGYLFHFNVTGNRQKIGVDDPRLEDRVADNTAKFNITESESLLIGMNFGVSTDIQTGPNGNLFVVTLSNGAVYEISRTH